MVLAAAVCFSVISMGTRPLLRKKERREPFMTSRKKISMLIMLALLWGSPKAWSRDRTTPFPNLENPREIKDAGDPLQAAKSEDDDKETNKTKEWELGFEAELTNYFLREAHAYFSPDARAWLESSVRLGATVHYRDVMVEVSGLGIKTTGQDPFGTGTVPTGSPPGTRAPGTLPALYLDKAYFQLAKIGSVPLKVTLGRQPIALGSQFLIGDGVYDGFAPSVRQGVYHNPRKGFDAIRLEWDFKGTHFDSFGYRVHPSWDGGMGRDGLFGGVDVSRASHNGGGTLAAGIFYRASRSGLDNDMALLNLRGERRLRRPKNICVSGELVWEFAGRCRNSTYCTTIGQKMNEAAWHAEFGYAGDTVPLKPFAELGYVYYSANFTPVATGFSDWGKWYLGNQIDWIVFGTNTKIIRAQAGLWPHATVKLRVQYHNTRQASPTGTSRGGSLSNEFSFIAEWNPREKIWLNLLVGSSRPGSALRASGLRNPFAALNSGAAAVGNRSSFDLVFATGLRFNAKLKAGRAKR